MLATTGRIGFVSAFVVAFLVENLPHRTNDDVDWVQYEQINKRQALSSQGNNGGNPPPLLYNVTLPDTFRFVRAPVVVGRVLSVVVWHITCKGRGANPCFWGLPLK